MASSLEVHLWWSMFWVGLGLLSILTMVLAALYTLWCLGRATPDDEDEAMPDHEVPGYKILWPGNHVQDIGLLGQGFGFKEPNPDCEIIGPRQDLYWHFGRVVGPAVLVNDFLATFMNINNRCDMTVILPDGQQLIFKRPNLTAVGTTVQNGNFTVIGDGTCDALLGLHAGVERIPAKELVG
jgi:hypothetical protein